MKHIKYQSKLIPVLILTLIAFVGFDILVAQGTEQVPAKKERARLSLDFHNENNNEYRLEATLKARINRYYLGVAGATIDFYLSGDEEGEEDVKLGSVETDNNGKAVLPVDFNTIFVPHIYLASMKGHPTYRDVSKDIEVKKAKLTLNVELVDSIPIARMLVSSYDADENEIPVKEVAVSVGVERLFGLLPIGEETETNEEGFVEFELPSDLPGDENGNLTVVARVIDHYDFGNIRASRVAPYGAPIREEEEVREIWLASPTSNTSRLLMLATSSVIMVFIGVVIYILLEVYRIKKMGKEVEINAAS